jgi:hypothetical protein
MAYVMAQQHTTVGTSRGHGARYDDESLLTPAEVAAMFRVRPKDGHALGACRQGIGDPYVWRAPAVPGERDPALP